MVNIMPSLNGKALPVNTLTSTWCCIDAATWNLQQLEHRESEVMFTVNVLANELCVHL